MWSPGYRKINKSFKVGQLTQACRDARQNNLSRTARGRRLVDKLVNALVDRAARQTVVGDLAAAWCDLGDAASIASGIKSDQVSRETNRLVDTTVQQAHLLMTGGKISLADRTIQLLTKRNILDQRADQIRKTCVLIQTAEQLAASGKMKQAKSMLEEIRRDHDELEFLDYKIRSYETQQNRLATLTGKLRTAINQSAWGGARDVSDQMLNIAPGFQLAVDAQVRCDVKQPNRDRHLIAQIAPDNSPESGSEKSKPPVSEKDTVPPAQQDTQTNGLANRPPVARPAGTRRQAKASDMSTFMLWVDGVGGFLVCTKPEIVIGQAVGDPLVDVSVQADIRRHHLKLRRADSGLLAEPLGGVKLDGQNLAGPLVLKDRQNLDLGAGVELKVEKTHPLGNTTRLKFSSRHRTQPWSDAIFLMGDAILLGPNSSNHIHCSQWKQDCVIFRRENQFYFRGPATFEVNRCAASGDVALEPNMHISAEDFSITFDRNF